MPYLLFIFAFFIRLIGLNQSLWLDEATTARVVQQYSFLGILTKFSPFDFHPPLYYWLIKFWTNIFGYSEISLRMPSVIFSLLTGYIVYKIARLLNGHMAGVWSAVFFLFNPLIVYYSQEARPYMMVTFTLTTALYYLSKILKNSKVSKLNINIVLFNVFLILSLFTFYGSIFLVIAFLILYLYKKQYKNLLICLFVVFFYLLMISPLLYQQFTNAKVSLSSVTNWSLVLGKANMKNLLLIPIKFSIGRIDFYPKWLYYLIAGGWTIFILSQIANLKSKNQNFNLKTWLLFLLITPLILGFIVSFFTPLLQYFRFIYLIPIVAILLGLNINTTIIRIIVTAGFLIFSFIYLLIPNFHREDWKSLTKSLPAKSVVYMIKSSSDPLLYYNSKLVINELTGFENLASLPNKIIIVPYTSEIYGYNYQEKLLKKNYQLRKKITFRNLYFEQWNKQ